MLKALRSWLLVAVVAFHSASVAAAEEARAYPDCTRKPTEAEVKAAKGAFQAGQVSFDEGDYDRAMTYWEDAYRRDCTAHALLLNLARVYELAGNKPQAVVALETYLARVGESGDREVITRRIQVLREKIDAEKKAADPAVAAPAPAPAQPAAGAAARPAATEPVARRAQPVDRAAPPSASPPSRRPLTPLIVAGGGAVVFVVGGILYLGALGDVNDFEAQCPDRRCPGDPTAAEQLAADANDARSSMTLWGVVSLVGAAAGIGGGIWYLATPTQGSSAARTQVSPAIGRGTAGLRVSGTF